MFFCLQSAVALTSNELTSNGLTSNELTSNEPTSNELTSNELNPNELLLRSQHPINVQPHRHVHNGHYPFNGSVLIRRDEHGVVAPGLTR